MLFLICVSAQAFQVILDGTGTNAIKILDLDIDGTAYDVTWATQTGAVDPVPCDSLQPLLPCDLYAFDGDGNDQKDQAGAISAILAIDAALNADTDGSGNSIAQTVGATARLTYFVPTLYAGGNPCRFQRSGAHCAERSIRGFVSSPPDIWEHLGELFIEDDIDGEFARFGPAAAVVSVPPAVWLFGSALGILGWIRRRTRATAVSKGVEASKTV